MNIGFISTWFERGAAYVTKSYIDALRKNHNVFVYARGGEKFAKGDPVWDLPYVTWGLKLSGTKINYRHFRKWILTNKIEVLFFNEQRDIDIIAYVKKEFPFIKIGAYVDYYKEDSLGDFLLYDFLICNTKRHYSVFKNHPQCYYVPWGTDTDLFRPKTKKGKGTTFFHSAGMSLRKGTKLLIDAFIEGKLYEKANLIIHSQLDLEKTLNVKLNELMKYNITIIQQTVTAPGLYHMGDIYVYPTTLDGLGLTIYEALSCGLPVITTNNGPMNEVVTNEVGRLVEVEKYYSRSDGYYWPLSICNKESLINEMNYYIINKDKIPQFRKKAREYAVTKLNWKDRYKKINEIFLNTKILANNVDYQAIINKQKQVRFSELKRALLRNLPDNIVNIIKN